MNAFAGDVRHQLLSATLAAVTGIGTFWLSRWWQRYVARRRLTSRDSLDRFAVQVNI